jgi:prophage antirepressor-like protein
MTDVEVFQFPLTGQQIRTVLIDDEPWFGAIEVCAALGLDRHRDVLSGLDPDEKMRDSIAGTLVDLISESALYSVILRSRKPDAKAFKRWVTREVLPTIRRSGRYEVQPQLPQTYAEALRELAATVERKERIERELEAAAPKAEAWDVLASAHGDYSVREAAFILNRDPAISTGATRLFNLLREWKLIDSRDIPYAAHERHVRLRARSYTHPRTQEEVTAKPQVRITHEGLKYLHRRLGGTEPLAA